MVQVLLAHFSPCVFHSSAHSLVVAAVWVKITVENTQDAKTDTLLTSERADLAGPELIMDCINENIITPPQETLFEI